LCVLCRTHPVDPRWRPFCSERCKWLDLSKWLDGEYRIPDGPVKEPDDDDDESDER
jgi:hypothetical protein